MSSSNQRKSLDLDLHQGSKRANYPQNVHRVSNTAEHVICYYHNEIEKIFGNYPTKLFGEQLSREKVLDLVSDICKTIDFNDDLSNVNNSLKIVCSLDPTSDPCYILSRYCNFVMVTEKLLLGINSKLKQAITDGLLRYCVSLADYCTSSIYFVVYYEKIIQRNAPEIIKEMSDIRKQYIDFKNLVTSTQSIMDNAVDINEKIGQIRASINKMYYLVTEWVDEERNYPSNLSEEMKTVKSQILAIQQRSDSMQDSISNRQVRLTNLDKLIQSLHTNQIILKRKHRRVRHSQQQIDSMIKQLDNQSSLRDSDLDTVNKKVINLEQRNSKTNTKKEQYKELDEPTTEEKHVKTKESRIVESKIALNRHRDRLSIIDHELCTKIENNQRESSINESTRDKLLMSLKDDNNIQVKDLEKLKELYQITEDLNFLFSRKNSPETMRQLRTHGKIIIPTKELKFIDKMCEVVAKSVPEKWREIYLNLPIYPARSKEKRSADISVIDLVSARNHSNNIKQAIMALNKWRLFYHNATTLHLIEGLKKSNLNDIAKEIEQQDAKSKHRYDED